MLSLSNRNYIQFDYDEDVVRNLIQKYRLKEIQARLIAIRGFDNDVENFLNPKVKNLMPNPSLIKNIDKATDIILSAIKNSLNILIWGDYDVDGVCSTSLLSNYFNVLGVKYAIHIPDRFSDGYGVNIDGLKRLNSIEQYDLIIMVDCGSNDNNSINYLKSLGKQIVIVDHHIIKGDYPNVDAFVNNKQTDDLEETKNLCATAMVFMLIVSINRGINNLFPLNKKINLLCYLDLVSLATVCDVVPLYGLNRAFVKTGVAILNRTENIGLRKLLEKLGIKTASSSDIGFQIGPSINAAGRLTNSDVAINLLNSNSSFDEVDTNANTIIELNTLRKTICHEVFQEALQQAKQKCTNNIILIYSNNWHEGIIGIVANKIKDLFQKPCCIISFQNNSEIGKGSGRSTDNFDLGEAIISASEFLIHGGGHKKAVGFSIAHNMVGKLEEYLIKYANNFDFSNDHFIDASISLDAINTDFYNDIMALEPFGEYNQEPVFKIDNVFITNMKSMGENHLSCVIKGENGTEKNGVSFNIFGTPLYDIFFNLDVTKRYSIIGRLIKNSWSSKISFVISDII